jgi:hypothetical protein
MTDEFDFFSNDCNNWNYNPGREGEGERRERERGGGGGRSMQGWPWEIICGRGREKRQTEGARRHGRLT